MISTKTDSELGPELMTIRGFQWIYGIKDDPYALLLRAEGDDPHDLGRRARERGRLFRSSAEVWVTAHHNVAERLLGDTDLGVNPPPAQAGEDGTDEWRIPGLHEVLPLDEVFLSLDRTDYARLTALVRDGLGDRFRSEAAGAAQASARRLGGGGFDLVHDFALDAAVGSLAAHLGVPDRDRFAEICRGCLPALDATVCPPRTTVARELITAARDLHDLIGAIGPERDDARAAVLLAAAGVEVAAGLIHGTVSALLDRPGAWAALRDDPGLASGSVREALRFAPPIRMTKLFARRPLEVAGQSVEAGDEVVVLTEAAGRDPEAFTDPGDFDPRRMPPVPAVYRDDLPGGVLACFALPVATAAVSALAARAPELRRDGDSFRRLRSPVTGGMLSAPAAFRV